MRGGGQHWERETRESSWRNWEVLVEGIGGAGGHWGFVFGCWGALEAWFGVLGWGLMGDTSGKCGI